MSGQHGGQRPGAGRPPIEREDPIKPVSVKVPESIRDKWRKHCKKEGKSQPEVFTDIVNNLD